MQRVRRQPLAPTERAPAIRTGRDPRVGIGMPVYNCEPYIRQAIESHLAQSFGDFELVIADNQSTDGTEAICREYVALDSRVRYVRNETNLGGPGNFNLVFGLCRGEFHKWSTADDWWDPSFLKAGVDILHQDPETILVYPHTVLVDQDGQETRRYKDMLHLRDDSPATRFIQLYSQIGLCQAHLGIIRRAAMKRTDLIGRELASDIRFLAELTLYGKFFLLPEYLFFRRFHETSSSWDRTSMERQVQYYAPRGSGFRFHTWRRYAQLMKVVSRAPIPAGEKWRSLKYLGRLMRWQRGPLFRELVTLGKPDARGLYIR